MKKYFLFLVLLPIFCFGQNSQRDSIIIKHKLHKHPLPLKIIGLSLLTSEDPEVQKLLGTGYYNPDEGHGGARYFWDITKNVQIKSVISVDRRIDQIIVTKPDYPFEFLKNAKNLESAKVSGKSLDYSVIGKITFGDNRMKIVNQFGKPNSDTFKDGFRILRYIDDNDVWNEVLYYEAKFTFKNDKLIRIDLYNGE